ncbi:MAG TPA: exodeoxyribonuclease VII large subunit [Acidimicrobiales bacterium]|nr:exodeoxyribonuclease VII large subunit [Acidimicrobiales bacterium]
MTLPLWPDEPGGRQPPRQLTLVRLAGEIARSLSGVGRIAVEGEVYRPQTSRSGWVYFTLRDRVSQVPVACPARHAKRCRAVNGERVMVVGQLTWVNEHGQLQLEAEEVTPVGAGAVAALIAEVRARLGAEGILDRERRPVPALPDVIGVVCGTDAAVRKDIESVVAARFPGYPVHFEETTVSGPGAAISITTALQKTLRVPGVQVVVLARGGGDAASLLPWSDEELCRAVAACPVPVVSAIGHEADRPLCDEVADVRCGTPSIAANQIVPDRRALYGVLDAYAEQVGALVGARCDRERERLARADVEPALASGLQRARRGLHHSAELLTRAHPAPMARAARRHLEACDWRRPTAAVLRSAHQSLGSLHAQARALSPQHVVERGFAIARKANGSFVRSPSEVAAGERLELVVAGGSIAVRVEDNPALITGEQAGQKR